jgi:hypothetical protein
MRTASRVGATIAVVVLLAVAGRAQVDNDTCSTATPIQEGLVTGNNFFAQNDMPVTGCGLESPFIKDRWYRFDAIEKGWLKATFGCAGADFDTGLFLYKGDCAALQYSGCNDDSCGFNSQIQAMVSPSTPLLIAVAGLAAVDPAGMYTLKVTVDRVSQFVIAAAKVAQGLGGFTGPLTTNDDFGEVAAIGDLDGNGVVDLAVGAPGDDHLGTNVGALWTLLQAADGTVLSAHKLEALGFPAPGEAFGASAAGLGDLDGDGTPDVVVAAPLNYNSIFQTGTLWVLFLAPDGTAKLFAKISNLDGGFGGALDELDRFGSGLAGLGDLDGDGVGELAVGADGDDDGAADAGAVWILFLKSDGSVKGWSKLSATSGGFPGLLEAGDRFGSGVGAAGDIDGDGVPDLAVGAPFAGPGNQGAIWTVLLKRDGTVKAAHQIDIPPGFPPHVPAPGAEYGAALCGMGDLDGNGVPDLAVGAPSVDHPGANSGIGAVFQVFLNDDATPQSQTVLTDPEYPSYFWTQRLGRSLAFPGDVDADGHVDLVIGDAGPSGGDGFMTVFLDPTNAWTTLGEGSLAGGNAFAPELRGAGTLQPGTPWSLELAIAARFSPAAFVAGSSTQFHPFKGGVLVPSANLVVSGLLTDSQGRIELGGLWPAGVPSGVQIWIQAWVVDNGGVAGFAASNAVLATTP